MAKIPSTRGVDLPVAPVFRIACAAEEARVRPIQVLVTLETIAIAVLGVAWWLRPGDAPLSTPRAGPATANGAVTTESGTVETGDATGRTGTAADPPAPRRDTVDAGTDAGSVLLHGRLATSDGSPLPERILLGARGPGGWRSATTLEDAWAIPNLAPGTWRLEVRADGFRQQRTSIDVGDRPEQIVDVTLEPAPTLRVVAVTPEGTSLATRLGDPAMQRYLHVVATPEPLAGDLPPTDNVHVMDVGIGRLRGNRQPGQPIADDGWMGDLWLDRDPPASAALLLRHAVLAQQPITVGQRELRFVINPATIQGTLASVTLRVVDGATGMPLSADVGVTLSSAQGGGHNGSPDSDGVVRFEGVAPGLYELRVGGITERESYRNELRVRPGTDLDVGDVILHPARLLRGRVLDTAGAPLPAAQLHWTDLANLTWPRELADRRYWKTDAEGRFVIQHVGPRRYVVVVTHGDLCGVSVLDGGAEEAEIRLRPVGSLDVTAPMGTLEGYVATLRDADGVPVAAARIEPRYPLGTLRAPTGRYRLEVHDSNDRLVLDDEVVLRPGANGTKEVGR